MAIPKLKEYTIDDIFALPDSQRAELINGDIYYMAPPSVQHQRIITSLVTQINNYIKINNGKCEVFPAPFAVFLQADDSVYVEPDVSVICDSKKLNEKGCIGAPDWIIEVVSPSSRSRDFVTKFQQYSKSEVKEYWIIDFEMCVVYVSDLVSNEIMKAYKIPGEVPVNLYGGNLKIVFN